MKISTFVIVISWLLLSNFGYSQNSISGIVKTQQNEGIFFATVGLYNSSDSLLAKAISTDDKGKFTVDKIKDGTYYLEVHMLGFKSHHIDNISFPKDNNKSFDINLSEDSEIVEGVEIKARLPLLEQKSDRLVVNVENNITSLNGSLLDVMKKVPGMIVTGDNLRMAGQTNVTIMINGKSTRYMDVQSLLRDMPGDNIKKVEVIHQPGAEFEANGTGPIINIILKKNSLYGTNGSVSLGVGKGQNWKYKTGLNLSHYQGPVNISGGIGFRDSPYHDELTLKRRVKGDFYDQHTIDPNFSKTFRSNLSVDWDINDRHRIGLATRYKFNKRDNEVLNNTNIDFEDESLPNIKLQTTNIEDNDWQLISINPYYTFEIDSNGQKLSIDYNYANYKKNGLSTLTSEVENNDEVKFPSQKFDKVGDTYIMAAKIDYTYPVNNNLSFQLGAKYSDADLDNNFEAFDEDNTGGFIKNLNQSNQFLFTEKIIAGYTKMTWKKNKWNGTMGLRYEDSRSEGKSVQLDTVFGRHINKYFPSVSLSREIKGPIGATVAYSYRIDRPRYSSLNPFRYYLDPFTFNKGNPNLQPALTHSAKFNLTYENQPFFNVEYKKTIDAMVDVLQQNDETGQTNQIILNLDNFETFNTSLFFPLDFIPKVSGYAGVIANYSIFESKLEGINLERSRWSYTTFFQTNFTLPYDIKSEVSGWYNSGELDGVITGSWLYGIDMGFSKKVLNNKGKISLGVDNLFHRPFHGTVKYSTVDLDVISSWDAPVVNAKFSYKFGNQNIKKKEKAGGSGNEMIRRAEGE